MTRRLKEQFEDKFGDDVTNFSSGQFSGGFFAPTPGLQIDVQKKAAGNLVITATRIYDRNRDKAEIELEARSPDAAFLRIYEWSKTRTVGAIL